MSGLEGAFSSQAKIKKITVADEEGIWLTVEGAVLDWNRLELLRGRFSVNELSAERIEVGTRAGAAAAGPGAAGGGDHTLCPA